MNRMKLKPWSIKGSSQSKMRKKLRREGSSFDRKWVNETAAVTDVTNFESMPESKLRRSDQRRQPRR